MFSQTYMTIFIPSIIIATHNRLSSLNFCLTIDNYVLSQIEKIRKQSAGGSPGGPTIIIVAPSIEYHNGKA
jgi:hypothetical protein